MQKPYGDTAANPQTTVPDWADIRSQFPTLGKFTFLNAGMQQELKRFSPSIEIRCFSEMERGLRDFINANSVPDAKLPPPEEAKQINKEQQSLPPLSWLNVDSCDAA